MNQTTLLSSSTLSHAYIQRMFIFRNIAILIQLLMITIAAQKLGVELPFTQTLIVVFFYFAFNLTTWLFQPKTLTPMHFSLQLSVDVAALFMLLYFTGGASNPFVSLLLLPLLIVAAVLPKPYIWSMALMTTLSYTLLMLFSYQNQEHHRLIDAPMEMSSHMSMGVHENMQSVLSPHALGMAFSFLFSVIVILFFVVSMAEALRERERKLAEAHDKHMRNEHVISLGTLAAGAAHELGTPLGTMAVLTKEMQSEYADDAELMEQLDILRSQVDRCKTTISQMSSSAGQLRAAGGKSILITDYITDITQAWQHEHTTTLELEMDSARQAPTLVVDETLHQALVNLLNNAAEASPIHISMSVDWDKETLSITIRDFGEGLSAEVKASLGTPFFTTKTQGQGLGVYLAQAVVSHLGGEITFKNHAQGGALVFMTIPLRGIEV